MSVRHTYNWSIASDSGLAGLSGSQTDVGSAEIPINQAFPAGSSGATVTSFALLHSTFMGLYLLADKNCAITFTGPGNTINLIAGTPYVWERSSGYFTNPFSADVTAATLTCTPGVNLKGRILNA